MFNFMKKAAEKDDKEKRKREKKERKDVKKRDRSSMSAEELLRLDEVNEKNVVEIFIEYSAVICSLSISIAKPQQIVTNYIVLIACRIRFFFFILSSYIKCSFGYQILR